MESRDGAGMLAAAAALLSARHARTPDGASSSVTGTSTSGALGGRVAAPAAPAAWSAPPLDYANRHAFTNAVSQYTETTRSIPSHPHDSMMQLSYPVEYAHEGATTDQRTSAAWGMSMDAPSLCKGDPQQQQLVRHQERQDQLSYQRLQEFQFQQQEEQQQQVEQQQQQLQQQLHRQQQQQQLQQQLRLHQQKQHQHQQQLLHQQHNQRQPNSQHTVVQQHQDSRPSQFQESQQPQPLLQQRQQWPPKNGKRPRQKQLKTNQKRKTQTHQRREIDAIVARAEQQPEFARPQYATQLQHASLTSQDDTLAGRGASAVIRPGQSIVPRPYQRRPVEANQRLKAMPGMTGFSSNNVPQDSRPLPAFRTMTGSGGNTTASVGMNQRFPRPAFPSSNDQSSRMWSYQHQAPSNGQPQSHQNLRIEGSNIPESIACASQPPPTQKQLRAVTATGQGMLSGLDSFVRQRLQHHQQAEQSNDSSHKMNPQDRRRLPGNMHVQEPAVGPHSIQPSLVTQATAHDSRIRASPTGQLSRGPIGHLTSDKHYYMPPPHQQPRTERRFENAMWTDQQSHSAVANQVDSDLARNAKVSMPGFADTEGCATSAKHKALLPSLNFQFEKQSDWYFPSPTSNKSSASQKIKSSTHGTSTMNHQAIENLKQLNQGTINSRGRGGVKTSWQFVGLTGTPHADVTIPERSIEAGKTDELNAGVTHNLKVSPVNETKLVVGHLSTVAAGVKSKNRLRKIEKQNRRQQRQETIKSGVGKQQLDASNVTQQQSLHVEQARAQLLEKSHESRLNQLPKTTKQPPGPHLVRQQQMLKEHRREAVFATRLRTVNATSSSQPTATASHTDARGDCVLSKTALLCEQEQLLRRAHLAMLAQQQLHQRNHIDFTPHTRPLPTVVAGSSTVSAAIAVHKRSRGEFEQQNVGIQNSTSGVRQLSQRSVSKHKEIEADGKRRQPDGSASAMGLEKDTNISAVQVTIGVKPADQGVSRIPAPVGAIPVPVSATSPRCATPATSVTKTTNAPRIEKAVKSRKRKASSVLAVPHSGAAQLSNPTVCKPRREKPSLGSLASSAVGVVADTVSLIAHPVTLPPATAVVPSESGYGLPGTESVMIFCKRDFFRFQAGLLWKKYQEIKRKRDQTLATVTGRRARYLNARYNSSNEGETEKSPLERARKRTHGRTPSASTSKDTGLDSEKSAALQSRAVSDNLCEPPDLGGVPHDSHMPCQEPEPTCPHSDLAASPVHESLAEEIKQRAQDGLVSKTSCVVATKEDSTSQSLLPPAGAAGSTHTSTVEAQTDEPWKPTNGPVSEPIRTESSIVRAKAFGDDNSEYVIIEEDTFGEWSCPSARDTSTASPTTPRTPPPSSECDTSGESQFSEAADVDPVVREQVQPPTRKPEAPSVEVKRTIDAPASMGCPTAAVTTVTTFQIVPTPLNSDPVAPNETPGGSEIAPSEKTADSQKVPVAYREECLI